MGRVGYGGGGGKGWVEGWVKGVLGTNLLEWVTVEEEIASCIIEDFLEIRKKVLENIRV